MFLLDHSAGRVAKFSAEGVFEVSKKKTEDAVSCFFRDVAKEKSFPKKFSRAK
jgi:predicted RecA/RadA family phage recombinase